MPLIQPLPDPPQTVRSHEYPGQDNGHAFARRNRTQLVLGNGMVDDLQHLAAAQDIHDQGKVAESLRKFKVHPAIMQELR
jgi:hypothetical protein